MNTQLTAGEYTVDTNTWLGGRATVRATPRKFPIAGQVRDMDGNLWDIRDVRDTKHGFSLYFGTPDNSHGAYHGGPARLIATKSLRDFWEANRTKGHGFLFDLPAGRTTLKRVRRRLGFNYRDDWTEFWTNRLEDLGSLPAREFSARHGVAVEVASDWRAKMIGRRARAIGWWRKPKIRKVLLSDLTLSQMGRLLDIGITHAKRLRDRAKLESRQC